jgi:hypothetical protein
MSSPSCQSVRLFGASMAFIAFLGATVSEYKRVALDELYKLEFYCPKHGRQLALHGQYTRSIKETGEEVQIYRLICHNCGATHAVLPDFLLPKKRYSSNKIEEALSGAETSDDDMSISKASVATKHRWARTMAAKLAGITSGLCWLTLDRTGTTLSAIRLADLSPLSQISALIRCLPAIRCSGYILGQALMHLGTCGLQAFNWA